ncbi:helix-turn-helix transcriptional regulator [Aquimarina sp. U1-2]|uniref:helix-turn-helix transcriptional regulator n=1 Tax=Aquimarina sp. U1-2 TaxID=2823141 RepID=UPI001AECD47E|nr:helix-turn-helix transcriptional regulator [Aquimarina sp. U1-2]MBP2831073.1 helix-turn-helix transcriptional regulator [Aquimarina sp. U1-2]
MQEQSIAYYDTIADLLKGLKTVRAKHLHFHIHRLEDAPDSQLNHTGLYRSSTYVVILLKEGTATYKIGLHDYTMCRGSLYFLGPRHLRHYHRDTNNWEGFVCLFSDDFTTEIKLTTHYSDYPYYSLEGQQKFQLNDSQLEVFLNYFKQLYEYYQRNSINCCWHQLHIILEEAGVVCKYKLDNSPKDADNELVINFNSALEHHFYELVSDKIEHLFSVKDYAEKLFVHPNHLSDVLRKMTGRSARQLITERLILEAKSLLKNSRISITQVAYILKFSDTSYFTKFFKKHTGMTPSEFMAQ